MDFMDYAILTERRLRMAGIVSRSSHDYMPTTIIPVIASFDTAGHIAPLYVRIGGESLKVDSYWSSCKFANSIEFHCKVIDHGIRKPLLLTYYKAEDIWAIPGNSDPVST